MYIYHAFINALGDHMIHVNLDTVFYTHIVHSPTKTIYNNNNNVHLSCVHQRPERPHDTY